MELTIKKILERISENQEAYKQFCEESKETDIAYQKNFPKDGTEVERLKYNADYNEKLLLLKNKKEKLDSEWKNLHDTLQNALKNGTVIIDGNGNDGSGEEEIIIDGSF